jgi:hypothetical protein
MVWRTCPTPSGRRAKINGKRRSSDLAPPSRSSGAVPRTFGNIEQRIQSEQQANRFAFAATRTRSKSQSMDDRAHLDGR